MTILVDYDNVPTAKRQAGIAHLVESILSEADTLGQPPTGQIEVRLYGGWYDRTSPSRMAQALVAELGSAFPYYHDVQSSGARFAVSADLAYSLMIDPGRHLWHTYRQRRPPADLACDSTILGNCPEPDCPIRGVATLIASGSCGHNGCVVRYDQILFRGQQKLVDTMIAMDLLHVGVGLKSSACVVSSDDDLWPAIQTAALSGASLLHVQPQRPSVAYGDYSRGMPANYRCIPLYRRNP